MQNLQHLQTLNLVQVNDNALTMERRARARFVLFACARDLIPARDLGPFTEPESAQCVLPSERSERLPGRRDAPREYKTLNIRALFKVNALIINYLCTIISSIPLDKTYKVLSVCESFPAYIAGCGASAPTAPLFLVIWCGTTIFFHYKMSLRNGK